MSRIIQDSGRCAAKNAAKIEHLWILALSVCSITAAFLLSSEGSGRMYFTLPLYERQIIVPDVCVFKKLLKIPCPGCGLTHSFADTVKGRFTDALSANLMGPFLFCLLLVQIPYRTAAFFRPHFVEHASVRMLGDLMVRIVIGGLLIGWVYNIACIFSTTL